MKEACLYHRSLGVAAEASGALALAPQSSARWGDDAVTVASSDISLKAALHSLLAGTIAVIRVPGFYTYEGVDAAVSRVLNSELLTRYANAPDIGKLGSAFFETLGGVTRSAYFESVAPTKKIIQDLFAPLPNPADCMLDAISRAWPGRASGLVTDEGVPYFFGLIRLFNETEALAHVDHLEWDDPGASPPIKQLALNTYLRVPEEGGELVVWNKVLSQKEHMQIARDYGVDEAYLCKFEHVSVSPTNGDLLIFDAQRVHAIRKSSGTRLTSSCFAILRVNDGPFLVYS